MRTTIAFAAVLMAGAAVTSTASAQTLSQRAATARQEKEDKERAKAAGTDAAACASSRANDEAACIKEQREQIAKNSGGQKLVIAALNAGNAKVQASDFDGAITDYQGGIAAAPGHPNLYELHIALANAYRARATKTFNGAVGPGVSQLPAAVLSSVGNDLRASLEEASRAAEMAGTDQAKLAKIGSGMRETAKLWVSADRAGVEATARPTLDTELRLFNAWAPTATAQELTQYTPGLAFALLPKDKDAALTLGDAMLAKAPTDNDTIIAQVQLVAEAKLPATDPRRAKAKTAAEGLLANGTLTQNQKVKLSNARIKLNAAT